MLKNKNCAERNIKQQDFKKRIREQRRAGKGLFDAPITNFLVFRTFPLFFVRPPLFVF